MSERTLDADELAALEDIRALADSIGKEIDHLKNLPFTEARWIAIATTQLQLGMMSLERAVKRTRGIL